MVYLANRRIVLFVLCCCALGLFMVDHTTQWLKPFRDGLNQILHPLFKLGIVSHHGGHYLDLSTKTREGLIQEIMRLDSELRAAAFTRLEFLHMQTEYESLRDIVDLAPALPLKKEFAQVLYTQISPVQHKIVINKGLRDGVRLNSILLDEHGIVGQIHFVSEYHSWATLLTDPQHSLPVTVKGKPVRGVLQGQGDLDRLDLRYVPETAPLMAQDQLVTSGLGGRFPAGYPVARVERVLRGVNESFAQVTASPNAALDRIKFVMVVPGLDEMLHVMDETPSTLVPLTLHRGEP